MPKIQITKKPQVKLPKKLDIPNLRDLDKLVDQYIVFLSSKDYHEDNDFDHYIFEAAVEAFYGPNVWNDYINKCMK